MHTHSHTVVRVQPQTQSPHQMRVRRMSTLQNEAHWLLRCLAREPWTSMFPGIRCQWKPCDCEAQVGLTWKSLGAGFADAGQGRAHPSLLSHPNHRCCGGRRAWVRCRALLSWREGLGTCVCVVLTFLDFSPLILLYLLSTFVGMFVSSPSCCLIVTVRTLTCLWTNRQIIHTFQSVRMFQMISSGFEPGRHHEH